MSEGKTVVITGASDGIGAAAARRLHREGHRVVVVGRSPEKTAAVAGELGVESFVADFTRLDEVRKLAEDLNAAFSRIDVLANNAGGLFGPRTETADGFEKTFQVNYLAPFLLTQLLRDKLIASGAAVLQTASISARLAAKLELDDLNHDHDFAPVRVYNSTKLEIVLFTKELHRRYHAQGVSAAAFDPGGVATNFATGSSSRPMRILYTTPALRALLPGPDKGAKTLVWLVQGRPGSDWESGGLYLRRKPSRTNRQIEDADLARALWDRTEELLK
ncbi:NAD(P)-dependent dehydrogenase (short-subunit alcohol dehydrogenase family) [Amycolatopsis bartoniae]|uniref:Short-chain dehydrogenase n=1 Tax=Amycolatopsis bartoniae TaxID=941986 RepID=A0A8H9ILX2_9PSEU|nr:SDR family NAD(P)-dependent oxidoreductase [Amycolatopsis bartoniae]MBB2938092.1 NAD(P)-dependent dehydrogenase (short-subunit alcohol dehydrogenase family) [Amycolatopsis bartoniae]TVT01249.1 SDR family NAD(P)-dependent oxidoreductase [Amycolatopsis bartoniae]GHF32609.1 short-chain dehydrogenase [Amycolatopsis bartoniae]